MRVLVTGATGFIGGHVVRGLLADGHQVVACVHRRAGDLPPDVELLRVDFARDQRPDDWLPRLAGVDAVVNAVGIIRERRGQRFDDLHRRAPQALFTACAVAGVRRVIQISALGADAEAASRYHLTKRAADDHLAALPLDWLILRPSIVYGPGAVSSALFRALAVLPWVPLVGDGAQPVQPVHVGDLVAAVRSGLRNGPSRRRVDVVGPEPITMAELLAAWRRWLGYGRMRALRFPYALVLRLAHAGGFVGRAATDAELIGMLRRGNVGDVAPFAEAFGFRPRSFAEELRRTPATDADRWHARLYFLVPLLRLSLAAVWIAAGLTSAFLYPPAESYRLLATLGIEGWPAPVALYGAALLDGLLGVALLVRFRVAAVARFQIALMLGYTAILTVGLPEFWLHPFGPVAKNLPLLVATAMLIALEERPRWNT